MPLSRSRGRPKGSSRLNREDDALLREIASLMRAVPRMKVTTALKSLHPTPNYALIRRIQRKWQAQGQALTAAAPAATSPGTHARRPVRLADIRQQRSYDPDWLRKFAMGETPAEAAIRGQLKIDSVMRLASGSSVAEDAVAREIKRAHAEIDILKGVTAQMRELDILRQAALPSYVERALKEQRDLERLLGIGTFGNPFGRF